MISAAAALRLEGGVIQEARLALGGVAAKPWRAREAEAVLAGEARCEEGALVVPMTGPSGAERVDFRIAPDGQWNAVMSLVGLPPELAAPLIEMGFQQRRNGVGLTASGTL